MEVLVQGNVGKFAEKQAKQARIVGANCYVIVEFTSFAEGFFIFWKGENND
jgi:predicted secreted protein